MEFRTLRLAPSRSDDDPAPPGFDAPLAPDEIRVLGALVEKSIATPDYYPMTLNGLVAACNQKSSRDPVVSYAEKDVLAAVDSLKEKGLVHRITSADGRVPRFRHLFHDAFDLGSAEGAALCVLMLRGSQTPGEIRQRSGRLHEFESLLEVEEILEKLCERSPRPLVTALPRRSGEKERRYAHLLGGEAPQHAEPEESPVRSAPTEDRLERLRAEVEALRDELVELRRAFEAFRSQFQ